jgi:hypothetical protein
LITDLLQGQLYHSKSIDIPDPDSFDSLPEECLNRMTISGLPEHNIHLKVGMSVVSMRNLYIRKGVCNGSRMLIVELGDGYLVGRLMSGPFKGKEVMIPKIKLKSSPASANGVSFYRYQFLLAPAYAMSVNKSQGQTLSRVGVMLHTDVFSHGQLYVALSRVSSADNVLFVKPAGKEKMVNVVHRSIFM